MKRKAFFVKNVYAIMILIVLAAIFRGLRPSPMMQAWKEGHAMTRIACLFSDYSAHIKSKDKVISSDEESLPQDDSEDCPEERTERFVALPDDVASEENEPLLSWRVAFLLELQELKTDEENDLNFLIEQWAGPSREGKMDDSDAEPFCYADAVDLNSPWDVPSNAALLENIPKLFNFDMLPSFRFLGQRDDEVGTTTIFRVKETHRLIKENKLVKGEDDALPYIVFIDSSLREPWTKPNDVSLEDVIENRTKLRLFYSKYWYIDANLALQLVLKSDLEKTKDEWRDILRKRTR